MSSGKIQKGLIPVYIVYILLITGWIGMQKNESVGLWCSNWFLDKSFVFLFSTVFLLGVTLFMGEWNWMQNVRFRSRKRILLPQLILLYGWAFLAVSVIFVCVIVGGLWLYGGFSGLENNLLIQCIQDLLAFLLMANLSVIFQQSQGRLGSRSPQALVFLVVAVDILLLHPRLPKIAGVKLYFIFSWVTYDGWLGAWVLGGLCLLSLWYLAVVSSKKDIL